jgi:hypothetical protein
MRLLLVVLLLLVIAGCAGHEDSPALSQANLDGFPSPAEIRELSPKATTGSYAALNRTLVHPGEAFTPWPGFSANAELGASGDAVLHGSTSALSFVLYQLNSGVVGNSQLIAQISADVVWPAAAPAAPHGVYIGLPDHVNDRWVWIDAREVDGKWLDVTSHNLHGLDPAPALPSYLAFVNHSAQDAHVNQLRLRFEDGATEFGDEYLYYTSRTAADPPTVTSVSRLQAGAAAGELIFAGDATTSYSVPVVGHSLLGWTLFHARQATGGRAEVYASGMDGAGDFLALGDPLVDWYPGGWNYGDNHALLIAHNGVTGELWGSNTNPPPVNGRLARETDNFGKAVWDIAADTAFTEYAAVAAQEMDPFTNSYAIVRVAGNPPFPINATPMHLYTPLAGEDARDPEMVELADFFGNAQIWVYFAARNRDDASYNIYRVRRDVPGEPEPVYVDAAFDLRYPAITPNGRYLAFIRLPLGSGFSDEGEIMLADLLNPGGALPAGPTDAVSFLSWYDPTP